jgi:natural product precursor
MKKLTRMSLEKLSKTMNVIPENEMDNYWGMYDNDCFWRCISYLSGTGITEEAAASYATNYFASQFSGSEVERIAQATSYLAQTGAGMTNIQMNSYDYNGINRHLIAGFPPGALSNYGFTEKTNHLVIFKGNNANGGVDMYCPQTHTHFTMSLADYAKRIF